MEKHPDVFSKIVISLIAIGEKTGHIDSAFKNVHENLKWTMEINRKTKAAFRGPLLSLSFMLLAVVALLKVVVPKIVGFILEQEMAIPIYTRALIKTSDFIQKYFIVLIGVIVILIIIMRMFLRNPRVRFYFDRLKLQIPLFGPLSTRINISRFSKFFGVTFISGIPILRCLEIANSTVDNKFINSEIEDIISGIAEGKTMSDCLQKSKSFPFIVVRMFRVGEESGNIESAMKNIQYFYDNEIADLMDKLVASIQPIMFFMMGILLCWIIVSVFGPIYGNFSNMKI
jgi:type IV pilus assembly protein PilC